MHYCYATAVSPIASLCVNGASRGERTKRGIQLREAYQVETGRSAVVPDTLFGGIVTLNLRLEETHVVLNARGLFCILTS